MCVCVCVGSNETCWLTGGQSCPASPLVCLNDVGFVCLLLRASIGINPNGNAHWLGFHSSWPISSDEALAETHVRTHARARSADSRPASYSAAAHLCIWTDKLNYDLFWTGDGNTSWQRCIRRSKILTYRAQPFFKLSPTMFSRNLGRIRFNFLKCLQSACLGLGSMFGGEKKLSTVTSIRRFTDYHSGDFGVYWYHCEEWWGR